MAIKNQPFVTDYFCVDTEKYNESQIREQFPVQFISTDSEYYPPNSIWCMAFGTRFVIPPLNGLPDWELLEFTLKKAAKGYFGRYRRKHN